MKLASSSVSPAVAKANLIPSAEYISTPSERVMKLPVCLDIFSLFSSMCPLARTARGHMYLPLIACLSIEGNISQWIPLYG